LKLFSAIGHKAARYNLNLLCTDNDARNSAGFFVLTAGLSGTFANILIPLQVGARDMASPFLNMFLTVFSLWPVCHDVFFIYSNRAGAGGWTVVSPLSACMMHHRI